MSYADYIHYSTVYIGNAIAEADFPRLALRASAQIDRLTYNRAATDTNNTTAIKNAMCAVAEEIQRQEQNDNVDGITSESQGQYSVSYGSNSNRARSNQTKIVDAAKLWLETTGLMFAGFASGEYGSELTNDS